MSEGKSDEVSMKRRRIESTGTKGGMYEGMFGGKI
jgi:hypothetical protein